MDVVGSTFDGNGLRPGGEVRRSSHQQLTGDGSLAISKSENSGVWVYRESICEFPPFGWSEDQRWAIWIRGIADGDSSREAGHFDARVG
jgi:hypothetical protein